MASSDPDMDAVLVAAPPSATGDDDMDAVLKPHQEPPQRQQAPPWYTPWNVTRQPASGAYRSTVGDLKGLADLLTGQGVDAAVDDVENEQKKAYKASQPANWALEEASSIGHSLLPATNLNGRCTTRRISRGQLRR